MCSLSGVRVAARDVITTPVETLGGEIVDLVKTKRGGVRIIYDGNVSKVVKANIMASNGIIHVIDNVSYYSVRINGQLDIHVCIPSCNHLFIVVVDKSFF